MKYSDTIYQEFKHLINKWSGTTQGRERVNVLRSPSRRKHILKIHRYELRASPLRKYL